MRPVRCYTCGKVIDHLYDEYERADDKQVFFEKHGIVRFCCRRMFISLL